ncbi:DinB family protein [Flammeovirga aprica]|uniref:DinB family protein n=1 Tax=Flammeovirga aprica JL-4 TaxID=694437 RepID=A0A7X9S0D9_9BACT|nr:DinB family protein [Flammeovirga aprica]NME72137.1 DinB family protein [Flammeovirga aprica JL-4]
MKINQEQFLLSLHQNLQEELSQTQELEKLPLEKLQWKKHDKAWNILECVYHLNLYGEFYIPHFQRLLKTAKDKSSETYTSGWLGNYFANSMKPKAEKVKNKMPSPKDKNPIGLPLEKDIINTRIQQINALIEIVDLAKSKDLKKKRCPITISTFITLQLGDALHFIINHESRHLLQIKKILHYKENINPVNNE